MIEETLRDVGMEIRKLNVNDEAAYWVYQTSLENGDNPFTTIHRISDSRTLVESSRAQKIQTTNPGYSTIATYYAFLNGKIAACMLYRWQLERGNLATIGGRTGYRTSPEFRRQGIMTKLPSLALEQYVKRGINSALITTRKDNAASRRTIEKAGNILENIIDLEDGHRLARYRTILDLENSD